MRPFFPRWHDPRVWLFAVIPAVIWLFAVVAYTTFPPWLAGFTVHPLWFGGAATAIWVVAGYLLFDVRSGLALVPIWLLTVLMLEDRGVVRWQGSTSPPGPRELLLVSANLEGYSFLTDPPVFSPGGAVPDIYLLQEERWMKDLVAASKAGGGKGTTDEYFIFAGRYTAIVVQGIIEERRQLRHARSIMVKAKLKKGLTVFLLNIHIQPAETDIRLWSPGTHRSHHYHVLSRNAELAMTLAEFESFRDEFGKGDEPVLIGGDFNIPAHDPAFSLFSPRYQDCFLKAGRGGGNTFPAVIPVYRLDRLFCNDLLDPVSVRVQKQEKSDHRALIARFRY